VKFAAVQFGFTEAAKSIRTLRDATVDLSEPLDLIVDEITEIEERIFNSEGRRGGGMWRRDSPSWQRRKAAMGGDPRVGHFRRNLRRSVTYRGDPNMVLRIDGRRGLLVFGSRLPYSLTMQKHRRFIKFVAGDRKRFAAIISKHVVREFKGRARRR
jgi:hypothetical protein